MSRETQLPRRLNEDATSDAFGALSGTGYRLYICAPSGVSSHQVLEAGAAVLGRSDECDVSINDASVSRTHARVHGTSPPEVEDLGSRNGTRIGDLLIPANVRTPIPPGATLHIGDVAVVIQAVLGGPAPAPPTPILADVSREPVVIDAAMKRIYSLASVVAPSSIAVLILGETGTGKEVLTEEIHRRSLRASGPLLRINCAAFTESLLESELFGHEKGAFTGALGAKPGLFESADGGTVLLDEIGETPLSTQAKLLRVLESGEVLRIGSVRPKKIDVRILSATNREPQRRIAEGLFRADLFFRLNGITMSLPPLRDRPSEILPLAHRFAAGFKHGARAPSFTQLAEKALERHTWPGNVRELRNIVERAVVLCAGRPIDVGHLLLDTPPNAHAALPPAPPPAVTSAATGRFPLVPAGPLPGSNDLRGDMALIERDRIATALERCGGNQSQAARELGISRGMLLKRIAAYGLGRPRRG